MHQLTFMSIPNAGYHRIFRVDTCNRELGVWFCSIYFDGRDESVITVYIVHRVYCSSFSRVMTWYSLFIEWWGMCCTMSLARSDTWKINQTLLYGVLIREHKHWIKNEQGMQTKADQKLTNKLLQWSCENAIHCDCIDIAKFVRSKAQ